MSVDGSELVCKTRYITLENYLYFYSGLRKSNFKDHYGDGYNTMSG